MSRTTSRQGRRRLPAVTRSQLRRDNRDLRHQLDGAERFMGDQQLRIQELEEQLAAAGDAEVLRREHADLHAAHKALRAEFVAVRAQLENATAIHVPATMHRDDGLDQIAEPIHAAALREWAAEHEAEQQAPVVKPLAEALGGVA
jgi:hypothetical protein